jgi:hypothetical protein
VTEFPDRGAARAVVAPLLDENRAIFERYGPHIDENAGFKAVGRSAENFLLIGF